MIMAADSNMSFHNGVFPSSFCNQVVVSFQSGAVNGTAGVVQGGINNSGGISSSSGMVRAGNPSSILNNTSSMMLQGNSQSSLFLEPMAGLKHDTGLAVDWSYKEQAILHHGLIKYADQPSILKYIKIAALLPEKTVRDVALRCRWMSRKESDKRRKLEEFYTGKKLKDRKEKMVNSSTMENIHQGNVAGYPFMMHQVNHNNQLLTEAPAINDAIRRLIQENAQVFGQIVANLERLKVQDNADLFLRTRNNITAILNSMSGMPGIMSQMPPLPVTINEDLVTTILPNTSQPL
ncbi:uncharacterized protein LOC110108083 isoform X2 [Dendrobium catenatum]|uniref:uncharacterized protein LOC110108083 isoform X2 n=1 Tax=Dendrobium catenatum TaxID=906689 RepID=UPI00109F1E0D|nr:uncharacterized protein LOC110108083 isoform X2 [Dendrobium catenatum]